jgi:hypothetical protein
MILSGKLIRADSQEYSINRGEKEEWRWYKGRMETGLKEE